MHTSWYIQQLTKVIYVRRWTSVCLMKIFINQYTDTAEVSLLPSILHWTPTNVKHWKIGKYKKDDMEDCNFAWISKQNVAILLMKSYVWWLMRYEISNMGNLKVWTETTTNSRLHQLKIIRSKTSLT